VSDVSAPAYSNGIWPLVQVVYGTKEETVDHVVLQCPILQPTYGLHGVTMQDDETIEWMLNTCPQI